MCGAHQAVEKYLWEGGKLDSTQQVGKILEKIRNRIELMQHENQKLRKEAEYSKKFIKSQPRPAISAYMKKKWAVLRISTAYRNYRQKKDPKNPSLSGFQKIRVIMARNFLGQFSKQLSGHLSNVDSTFLTE